MHLQVDNSKKAVSKTVSMVLILLLVMNFNVLPVFAPIIPDPGVSVSPGSVCCDGCGSLTIPVKNIRDVSFNGHIDIKISDSSGNIISQDSIRLTLASGESRVIQTPICPSCKSLRGSSVTYQVTATIIEDNGKIHDTKSAYFVVRGDCPKQCPPGPTETYQCADNKVKRLYKDADCSEHWEIIKDCDQCNDPPCQCSVGNCIHVPPPPPPPPCDQVTCQSQNGPFGVPYSKDGKMYQRSKDCYCEDSSCKCESSDNEILCTGVISGKVTNPKNGNQIVGASVTISQNKYLLSNPTNESGYFSSAKGSCPLTVTTLTCSAKGYISDTRIGTTDIRGDLVQNFELSPLAIKIELASSGYQKYKAGGIDEPVYFRGNDIDVKIDPTPEIELTYGLVNFKTGDMIGDEIQASANSVKIHIPDNTPIGEYYIKCKETEDISGLFYVIFNPELNGLTNDEFDKFWESEGTGTWTSMPLGVPVSVGKCIATNHYTKTIFEYAITQANNMVQEKDVMEALTNKVREDLHLVGTPPIFPYSTSASSYINIINKGNHPDGDCKVIALLLISLYRSVGIPCRMVSAYPTNDRTITGHDWIEVYSGKWIVWDGALGDENNYEFEIGSDYIDRVVLRSYDNPDLIPEDPLKWHLIMDETYQDRRYDYSK